MGGLKQYVHAEGFLVGRIVTVEALCASEELAYTFLPTSDEPDVVAFYADPRRGVNGYVPLEHFSGMIAESVGGAGGLNIYEVTCRIAPFLDLALKEWGKETLLHDLRIPKKELLRAWGKARAR